MHAAPEQQLEKPWKGKKECMESADKNPRTKWNKPRTPNESLNISYTSRNVILAVLKIYFKMPTTAIWSSLLLGPLPLEQTKL